MKIAVIIVRILLALQLLVSTVFVILISMGKFVPPAVTGPALTFNTGLAAAVYMMPLIKFIEVLCAISFLTNRYTVLATVVLFPITLNIFLFHAFLGQEQIIGGFLVLAANLFLAYVYRSHYKGLFVAKA